MAQYLTLEEILRLHFQVIEDFGGSHGVRDESRLKSVVQAQYPSLSEKAAVYMRNIIGDHPFSDDNKRTAVTVCGIFLLRNGHQLNASPKELEDFAVWVAEEHLDVPAIVVWLEQHTAIKP